MAANPQILNHPTPALPQGRLTGPAAWRGADMVQSEEWMLRLDATDIAELDTALARVEARGIDLIDLDREGFELDRLGAKLEAMREDVLRGRGFALVRGLPTERLTFKQAATLYWGIGQHLGTPVSQNGYGHLLGHVIDIGRAEDDPNSRIYQTNARQYYHADSCDVVALLCWRKAKEGGFSTIVSSETVYNEMLDRAPDLVEELFATFHVDRRGEVPEGANPWHEVPVCNWYGGRLTTYYVRRYIESARRFEQVPPLTERQIAAFDAMDAICEDPDIHLSMEFEPGDMQFLHNPQILHDRTGFIDFDEPEQRRHLLRLWLCPPDGRPLPEAFAQRWGSVEIGNRGGVRVPGMRLVAPLDP